MTLSSVLCANNKSPAFASWTSQLLLTPLTTQFFLIVSLLGSASTVLLYPGSSPTSQTALSSHLVATPNPQTVRLLVAPHKALSLAHFFSLSTQPHLAPSLPQPASVITSMLTILNFSFLFYLSSYSSSITFFSHLSLKSLLGCLLISSPWEEISIYKTIYKTEFLIFGNSAQLSKLNNPKLKINTNTVHPAHCYHT